MIPGSIIFTFYENNFNCSVLFTKSVCICLQKQPTFYRFWNEFYIKKNLKKREFSKLHWNFEINKRKRNVKFGNRYAKILILKPLFHIYSIWFILNHSNLKMFNVILKISWNLGTCKYLNPIKNQQPNLIKEIKMSYESQIQF